MTDFGEILEPSSRAFWDDFDYEQEENTEVYEKLLSDAKWEWNTTDEKEPHYSKILEFYVIEGTGLQDFVESTITKNFTPIGGLRNKNIRMYYVSEKKQIIMVSLENDLNISAIVSKYFETFIKEAENVYTFTLQSKTQYKGTNNEDGENNLIFIRGINSKLHHIEELKSPNFITGLAAGVATIRFLNQLSYSSYIAFTEPLNDIDAFAAKPILELFKHININCENTYVSKFKDSSLLYM